MARGDSSLFVAHVATPAPIRPGAPPRPAPSSDRAARGLAAWQTAALVVGAAGCVLWLIADVRTAFQMLRLALMTGFAAAVILRLGMTALSLAAPRRAFKPLRDQDLPPYSIIVPLFREAEVAPDLVKALAEIDYPQDRLQALVVLEDGDQATYRALAALRLAPFIQVLVAPPGFPRTKPRACNVALARARGEHVVVYDAEDRPHPMQLREAAARFAQGGRRLACLQAPLRIDPDRRFIPAQFALEYAVQFEVMLPALARLGAPFPLGGTSNHFRTDILREVGGWDAYNVTEDADLGFHLAAKGCRLGVLDSPTFEPAPRDLHVWLPQRARWIKGHLQTLMVHTRTPWKRSPRFNAAIIVTLALSCLSSLIHGPAAAWLTAATLLGWLSGDPLPVPLPDTLLLTGGWSVTVAAGVIGLGRAGSPIRLRDLLLAPLYWPMLSLAALHAVRQLIASPHHWDKTRHEARAA